jgi:hypothetical protein
MEPIFFYTTLFVLGFFPFLAVLAAGGGLEVLLRGVFQNPVHPELSLVRIVVLGFVWTLGCFGVGLVFCQVGFRPSACWSLVYFFASAAIALLAWRHAEEDCREIFSTRTLAMLGWAVAIAALMQLPSLLWFPHIMDSTQLGWTNRFTDPLSIEYGEMNGAVGYSGIIFFTGLLAPHLPLAVSAASTKILLYFLCILLAFYIARVFYGPNFRFGVVLSGVVLLGSSFGVIVLASGKDSLIGVVLSVFFVSSLADGILRDKFRTTALFCGAAACMGVISVPFMAVAGGLAFLMVQDLRAKIHMAASHLLIAGPLAAFAAHAMAKVPFWYVALGLPVVGIVLAGAGKFWFWDKIKLPKVPFWVPILVVLATFLIGIKVLPYKLEFTNFTAPFLEPLDGKVGLIGLLYEFNPSSGFVTGLYILGPILALWIWRKENPIGWAAFLFNQVTLAFFLILCQSDLKLIDGPSQWTLIKNCIHYYLPLVASMAVGPAVSVIPNNLSIFRGFSLFLALVFAGSILESFAKHHSKSGLFYLPRLNGVVQSRSSEISSAADFLWKRNARVRLLIDSETGFLPIGDFQYFSPRVRFSVLEKHEIFDAVAKGIDYGDREEIFILTRMEAVPSFKGKMILMEGEGTEISKEGLVLLKIQQSANSPNSIRSLQ